MSKTVDEVLQEINEHAKQAMEESCTMIDADAKLNCPVRTGTLRRSITHEVTQDGSITTGAVGSNVEYAPYVELKKHFFEGAIDKNQNTIVQKFQDLTGGK